ncbi:leucine-rich repeat-containing protein 71 isoform X2 [Nematostella vectensis]|uniref:leucine-rich repeat-containing protein 71 isoform X2 n=1 Tax=Nematostella vectensis TaxID=45351 RepID=UPI00207786BE|nr:leucine-rich repeat-containing protein 71 isoform X2 [Nematostella vectensis]
MMFATLRSVSKMKRSLKKGERPDSRCSSAVTILETPEIFIHRPVTLFGEPYTPTGNFETDFHELCLRAGFPSLQVVPRPHRPPTPSPIPQENTPVTGKVAKDAKEDTSKAEDSTTLSGSEQEDPPPTTFTTKDKYTFFKPKVEVETEEEGNKSFIKEIYIRGWTIDDRILEILTVTLPPLDRLTTINLWNNGLTDSRFNLLASTIQSMPNIKALSLDNNPLILQRYNALLGEESTIQHLSLRNCYVNDMGAKMIGDALTVNKSLTTLNLCYNKITCDGAAKLAKGLRMNRILLTLNLGSNLIGDNGASKLAEVISSFSLSHEEIIARRLLISKKSPEEGASPSRSLNAPIGGSKERPASVRSGGHLSKEERKSREKDRASKKKEGKKQEEKAKKSASIESVKAASKGKKASAVKGDKKGAQQPEQEQPEVLEFPNPLLEIPLKEEGGEIVIPGNRALISINLARNKVSEMGVEAFLIAVQRQTELISSSPKPSGLMRLSLAKNKFAPNNGTYLRLMDIMQTKDPFYKPPEPAEDTISTIKEDP